jgi:ribokinase
MEALPPMIVVVGSLNVDHTLRVSRIPAPGETLTASGAFTCFGGKGANQAVAAARAGARVTMIGCVGRDDFGTRYLEHLQNEGIATSAILQSDTPTGSAFIAVDDRGENSIIVNPGANHALEAGHIEPCAAVIRSADALLLQLECPLPTVKRAAEIARASGVRVILNPSPWSAAFMEAGIPVDVLIVNANEAEALSGLSLHELLGDIPVVLNQLQCRMLVITRGGGTTLVLSAPGSIIEVPPPVVDPVDTVGAGDTFAGALTVALSEAQPLHEVIRFANSAGALATLKPGAQPAIPTRAEIHAFMTSHSPAENGPR